MGTTTANWFRNSHRPSPATALAIADRCRKRRRAVAATVEALESRTLLSAQYSVTDLGASSVDLGAFYGAAINDNGQVTGQTASGVAFLYSNGTLTEIPGTGEGRAINNNALVVGNLDNVNGFFYDGTVHTIPGQSDINGINAAGLAVGSFGPYPNVRPFEYDTTTLTEVTPPALAQLNADLTGINSAGDVVGVSNDGSQSFIYANGTLTYLPVAGVATAINDADMVAGYTTDRQAFIYQNGQVQMIGPAGDTSFAFSINNAGQVVGQLNDSAFLYSNGQMIDLNSCIPSIFPFYLNNATAINNRGQIVSNFNYNPATSAATNGGDGTTAAFLLTPLTVIVSPADTADQIQRTLQNVADIVQQSVDPSTPIQVQTADQTGLNNVLAAISNLHVNTSGAAVNITVNAGNATYQDTQVSVPPNMVLTLNGATFVGAGALLSKFAQYSVTDLGPGVAYGLNDSGQVTGEGFPNGGAFLYSNGTRTDLAAEAGHAISGSGVVVGFLGSNNLSSFFYDGTVHTIPGQSDINGINAAGLAVGSFGPYPNVRPFEYDTTTLTEVTPPALSQLGSNDYIRNINSAGDMVGVSDDGSQSFLYKNGNLTWLPASGVAYAINSSDQIAGDLSNGDAFVFQNGQTQDLGPGAARAINDAGQVVGSASGHAFVYSNGVETDLNTLIAPNSGWSLNVGYGINNLGQIVGDGYLNGQQEAFLLTPLPLLTPLTVIVSPADTADQIQRTLQNVADIVQQSVDPSTPIQVQTADQTGLNNVLAAISNLQVSTIAPTVNITVNAGNATYQDTQVSVPPNVVLTLNGATFIGGSPALTVNAGVVVIANCTLSNSTASPTILVKGGTLTLLNDSVQRTGVGALVENESTSPVSVQGTTTFLANGQPIDQNLQGMVWVDFNNDGNVDFGEQGINGVTITLSGKDDLGDSVSTTTTTANGGIYSFNHIRPGTYSVSEGATAAAYVEGKDSLGTLGGIANVQDVFSNIPLGVDQNGLNYNFGEQPAPGSAVGKGQAAGIGFWQNKNGQALILKFTSIGSWLADTLPQTFGSLASASPQQVATLYQQQFVLKDKLDAQVMATALNVYATDQALGGLAAAHYGFTVGQYGLGDSTWNVGSDGAAFNVANSTTLTVMQILQGWDQQTNKNSSVLRKLALDIFGGINGKGGL